ncbi:MAG: hypothetical protein JNK76_19125 [Planctomycetales bacterium]|nr:hypothetical protein [Planctomycetales bacterium]MBN8627923.1 hypothetical protein [Planctomycetota bacterium]
MEYTNPAIDGMVPPPLALVGSLNSVGVAHAVVEEALALTMRMFGPTTIEEDFDPEFSDMRWLTFITNMNGSTKEIVERENEWGRQIQLRWPGIETLRLMVCPRQ